MDMYEYIATANPGACQALAARYGYEAQAETTGDLGDCMGILVEEQGLPALRDLVDLHPDKELILEQLGGGNGGNMASPAAAGCGCTACQHKKAAGAPADALWQWTSQGHLTQTHQAGLFIIGGLLVLTLAIISSNKSS
jgi:hypothetical protein